jgi:hypothetical protein
LPDVADPCGESPKREPEPIKSGKLDDPGDAAACRKKPRLGARKGQKKGNVSEG